MRVPVNTMKIGIMSFHHLAKRNIQCSIAYKLKIEAASPPQKGKKTLPKVKASQFLKINENSEELCLLKQLNRVTRKDRIMNELLKGIVIKGKM